MPRYRIVHRTEYRYDPVAARGRSTAHLRPRSLPHQDVLAADLAVEPAPTHRHDHLDDFQNHVSDLVIDQPHDHLVITAVSDVELRNGADRRGSSDGGARAAGGSDTTAAGPTSGPAAIGWDAPWEVTVVATERDTSGDGALARTCRLDSPRVERLPELHDLAATAFTPGRPLADAAAALTRIVHDQIEFVPGVTDPATPVRQVLAERRGVCQDLAHVLLGALRCLGLGARYVSGYIETEPPPGQPRLIGADASHAWVGLYTGDGEWVDLDPSNGLVRPERHITLAWGRDYTDVAPVCGIIYGPPIEQQLAVSVDVSRLP